MHHTNRALPCGEEVMLKAAIKLKVNFLVQVCFSVYQLVSYRTILEGQDFMIWRKEAINDRTVNFEANFYLLAHVKFRLVEFHDFLSLLTPIDTAATHNCTLPGKAIRH